jgi:hypothetical protein
MEPAPPASRLSSLPFLCVLALAGGCDTEPLEAPWKRSATPLALTRTRIRDVPAVGAISDLRIVGEELLVAGTCGVARLELATGSVPASAAYPLDCPPYLPARFADVDGDGSLEIVRLANGWVPPVAVLELDGALRWVQNVPAREDDLLDSDGDGCLEILVGNANESTVYLLDCRGNVLWQREWGPSQNGVVDGARELVYADGEVLAVCTADGERIRTIAPPRTGYVNSLEKVAGLPGLPQARFLVGAYVKGTGQLWWAYGEELDVLGTVERGDDHFAEGYFERVTIDPARKLALALVEEKHQAPVAGFKASWLRVALFDADGACVFEEPLEPGPTPVAGAPGAHAVLSTRPLRLLVGYGPTLWEYREDAGSGR